jgi:hypothetical protein
MQQVILLSTGHKVMPKKPIKILSINCHVESGHIKMESGALVSIQNMTIVSSQIVAYWTE